MEGIDLSQDNPDEQIGLSRLYIRRIKEEDVETSAAGRNRAGHRKGTPEIYRTTEQLHLNSQSSALECVSKFTSLLIFFTFCG